MITTSQVVKANAFRVIINALCFEEWRGEDAARHIRESADYEASAPGCEQDTTAEEAREYYRAYIDRMRTDTSFCKRQIDTERTTFVVPPARSVKEFFTERHELSIETVGDFQRALSRLEI